jgi:hypothetical protein
MEAMSPEHIRGIKEILGLMKCSQDFRCIKAGYQNVCKAKDVGLDNFLECLESDPQDCEFSTQGQGLVLCSCRLRVYLTKTVGM